MIPYISTLKRFRYVPRAVPGFGSGWWLLLVLLAGCSGLPAENVPEIEPAAIESTPTPSEHGGATDAGQVEEGLSADLLYDLLLSSIAFQEGEIEVASDALTRAASITHDPVIVARAVRMSVHSGHYQQAAELGQRWVEFAPDDHQAYIITALAAVMDQQGELALDLLTALIEKDTGQGSLRLGQIGEVFLQHASGKTAQQVLEQLAGQYPDHTEAWLVLAGMAQKNEDFAGMNQALDRILKLEPGNEKAAAYKLLAMEGSTEAQARFALDFLADYPTAKDFRLQYAQLLIRMNLGDQALQQLLILLEGDPANAEILNLTALLYQAREDFSKAAKYFELKIKAVPGDDRSRLYLANAYQQLERYDDAKSVLAAVSEGDELFNAQRQMALLIEAADGVEAGLNYLETLQGESEAQASQLIVDHELMLQRAGRIAEAFALVNSELEKQPDNDTLRYHRALMSVQREDLVMHEADMRVLLERSPDDPHYNNTLGYTLLVMSDRLDEAELLINRAYQAKPDDPYILDSKGWLEYKLGRLDRAIELLLAAFAQDQDAEIAAHIGEVYWAKGDRDKAREYWQRGEEIDSKNASLIRIMERFLGEKPE